MRLSIRVRPLSNDRVFVNLQLPFFSRGARAAWALLGASVACAQTEPVWPIPAVAEGYVQTAWAQNLQLGDQALNVDMARARAQLARAARGPRVDANARYSLADGGRTIDVPAGDLLNPAYRTLNELLTAQGRPAIFPVVSNLAIPLLRDREQDTRIRVTLPVFNAELANTSASRRATLVAAELQHKALRRDVRLGVLTAYYNYLRSRSAEQILVSAVDSTSEAWRMNRVLFENDKVTEDRVLRAEADDLAVRQQVVDAIRERELAQRTFNVLLHRPLETAIEEPSAEELERLTSTFAAHPLPDAQVPAAREELAALDAAVKAAAAAEAAARSRSMPTLSLVADGGIQGPSYRFGSGANYVQGSLIGEFNLWDGQQRRREWELARAQRRRTELQVESVREQLALELRNATSELTAARSALPAAQRRVQAAARAFTLVEAREQAGLMNQLAFLDARQTHTAARLNLEMTRQRLFLAAARLERALAASPLP